MADSPVYMRLMHAGLPFLDLGLSLSKSSNKRPALASLPLSSPDIVTPTTAVPGLSGGSQDGQAAIIAQLMGALEGNVCRRVLY